MKITGQQLSGILQRGLQRLYLLTSSEPLLIEEARAEIIQSARASGFLTHEKIWLEAGFAWEVIINSCASYSLFSDKKIIDLRLARDKAGDGAKSGLQDYLNLDNPDCILIISAPKLNKTEQRAAWFKLIESRGVVITLWPPKSQQLPQWINQRAQQLKLHLNPNGLKIIADFSQGNLLNAKQSLDKLKLVHGEKKLSTEEVQACIYDGAKYDVFNLVDSALLGKSEQVVNIFNHLKHEGTEPTFILWALTKEIRLLGELAQGVRAQHPLTQLFNQHGIWESRRTLYQQALQRITQPTTQTWLHQAHRIDKQIKGIESGHTWDSLMQLSLNLAGCCLFPMRLRA